MTADLREATTADLFVLLGLVAEFYEHERIPFRPADVHRALTELITTPALGGVWLMEEADGATAGYLVLTFGYSVEFGGRCAIVDELYVKPEHRGQGSGTAALKLAESACRALGVRALRLEVDRGNPEAARLYQRLGYVAESRNLFTLRL